MTTHDQHAETTHSTEGSQPPTQKTQSMDQASTMETSTAKTDSTRDQDPSTAGKESAAEQTPPYQPIAEPTGASTSDDETSTDRALFADDELAGLRARWDNVQAGFVDDPRECVQKADGLVSDVVERLTSGFTQARSRLEEQWARGEEASTEDLRVALKRYREFFERLLAV
jgi:hypothetical protein